MPRSKTQEAEEEEENSAQENPFRVPLEQFDGRRDRRAEERKSSFNTQEGGKYLESYASPITYYKDTVSYDSII